MNIKLFNYTIKVETILIGFVLGFIICYFAFCRSVKEGMTSNNDWLWAEQIRDGLKDNGKGGTHPNELLDNGKLFMFSDTSFDKMCCPNPYSTREGCACMNKNQASYLLTHGGNHTSPDIY